MHPEIEKLAEFQHKKMELKINDGLYAEAGWKTDNVFGLLGHLMEEIGELAMSIRQTCYGVKEPRTLTTSAKLKIVDESADVANLAMMIADRVYDLMGDEKQKKKGSEQVGIDI